MNIKTSYGKDVSEETKDFMKTLTTSLNAIIYTNKPKYCSALGLAGKGDPLNVVRTFMEAAQSGADIEKINVTSSLSLNLKNEQTTIDLVLRNDTADAIRAFLIIEGESMTLKDIKFTMELLSDNFSKAVTLAFKQSKMHEEECNCCDENKDEATDSTVN